MTEQLTPEEIQEARRIAQDWVSADDGECDAAVILGRAVLVLTEQLDEAREYAEALVEQQLEPVSRDELVALIDEFNGRPGRMLAELSRYTIARKQPEGADHGE